MITLTVRSNVGLDGTLRLEVPSGLPPGPVDVVVVVQSVPSKQEFTPEWPGHEHRPHRARSGLFLNRGLSAVDVDEVTETMESAWKTKLADLEP